MTIYYKDKTLPNRFKECRIANNLTQAELCKLLGFTGNKYTVYNYESNKRLPNIKTMIKCIRYSMFLWITCYVLMISKSYDTLLIN
mgnify:CR=1 FL=1